MIMQRRQVNRFLKLFDSLTMYCAAVLDIPDLEGPVDEPLDGHDMRLVIYEVWGDGGDPSVIDRYLEENPDHVNRTDLREIASWKSAIFEDFSVTRDGGNVYFMLGGYAFAVRGFDYEVDDDLKYVPTYAMTLLLPFDGIITYGLNLVCSSEPLFSADRDEVEDELAACKAAGHVVRTSRQFVQAAPLALEEALRRDASAETMEATTYGPGTHEGALSGLVGDERHKARLAYIDEVIERPDDLFVSVLDGMSTTGAPVSSLRELLMKQTANDLKDFLRSLGVKPTSSHRSKRQLLDKVMATMPMDSESVEIYVLMAGARAAEWLKDCYEAGGRMVIKEAELTEIDEVPDLAMPLIMSFHEGDEFCLQVFQEFMPELGSMDLGELVERARVADAFVDYVDLAVDFRGAIALSDAVAEGIGALGLDPDADGNVGRMTEVLRHRYFNESVDFTVVPYEGRRYLTAYGFFADVDDNDDDTALSEEDEQRLKFVLEDQSHYNPRTVEDLADTCESAFDWMKDTPEYRSLLEFLDAHVPDGANDYIYANKVVDVIFDDARLIYEYFVEDALEIMESLGYVPQDVEERATVVRLLEDYYLAVPKWQMNGWSFKQTG